MRDNMRNGKISKELAMVLRDKEASSKLRETLARGETIRIGIDGKVYRVSSRSKATGIICI